MTIYTTGTKVFCDFAFGGKPKGKVVSILKPGNGQSNAGEVQVKLTETVGAYRKGEVLTLSTFQAVPVKQELRLKSGQYFRRINTQYIFA